MLVVITTAIQLLPACSSSNETVPPPDGSKQAQTGTEQTPPILVLPERLGDRRRTSGSVPHVQLDVEPDPEIDAELRRRAFLLPGVQPKPSGISLPGAVQLALDDDLELARAEVIATSQEFAHIHPDGSLHIWLPTQAAAEVNQKKWGELHPWVERENFWDGVVMVYVPETLDEVDIAIRILVEAYNFVVGSNIEIDEVQ